MITDLRSTNIALVLMALLSVPCFAQERSIGCFVSEVNMSTPLDGFPKLQHDGLLIAGVIAPGPAAGKLKRGDVISSIGGKPITDNSSYKAILDGMPIGQPTEVIFFRLNNQKWQSSSIAVTPELFTTILEDAMKSSTHAGKPARYYGDSSDTPISGTLMSVRVVNDKEQYAPVLCVIYDFPIAKERLRIKSKLANFEAPLSNLQGRDGGARIGSFTLKSDDLDEFKKSIETLPLSVQLIDWAGETEIRLSNAEWVGIKTAIAFYEMKSERTSTTSNKTSPKPNKQ